LVCKFPWRFICVHAARSRRSDNRYMLMRGSRHARGEPAFPGSKGLAHFELSPTDGIRDGREARRARVTIHRLPRQQSVMRHVTVVRPYGRSIRQRVFALLERAGLVVQEADVIPKGTSDESVLERLRERPPEILLIPFHAHRDEHGESLNGIAIAERLAPARLQVQMHLGMCRHCRAYLHQMKTTVRTLGRLPQEQMPADIKAELLKRFGGMAPPEQK